MLYQTDKVELEVGHMNLPKVGTNDRTPEAFIWLHRGHYIIVSGNELLPVTARETRVEDRVTVTFSIGQVLVVGRPGPSHWPHLDTLNSTHLAVSYEEQNYLYCCVVQYHAADTPYLTKTNDERQNNHGTFHGVTGLDSHHFVMVVTGDHWNQTLPNPYVAARLATLDQDRLTFGEWTFIHYLGTTGAFAVDNLDRNNIIVVYSPGQDHSLIAVLLRYDGAGRIFWGPRLYLQSGGMGMAGSWSFARLQLRMLSWQTFGVMYHDDQLGHTVVRLGAVTPSESIALASPPFVISSNRTNTEWQTRGFDFCEDYLGGFFIVETIGRFNPPPQPPSPSEVLFHKGDSYPRTLGMLESVRGGMATVQFSGTYVIRGRKLRPGYAYYTTSVGDLREGMIYGYANMDFGHSVIMSINRRTLMSMHNLVGVAVDETHLRLMLSRA